MSDLPHIPAEFFQHGDSIPSVESSNFPYLLYPDTYTQQSTTNDSPEEEEEEDIQDVLRVLLDLHEQSKEECEPQQQFEQNYLTISKAIHNNEEMQNKVREQIELVDKQLDINLSLLVSLHVRPLLFCIILTRKKKRKKQASLRWLRIDLVKSSRFIKYTIMKSTISTSMNCLNQFVPNPQTLSKVLIIFILTRVIWKRTMKMMIRKRIWKMK